MLRLLLLVVVALVTGPALVNAQSLVLAGDLSEDNAPVWNRMVELAGGRGKAQIGIFTTATSDSNAYNFYSNMFAKYYGANTTWIPVTANSGNGNDPFIADVVRKQTGFFFEGGDQMRIANALRPEGKDTLVLQAVKEVLRNGGMVGGLSAGTACQGGGMMITSGWSWDALTYGAFPGGPNDEYPYDLTYYEYGGLGFLPGFILDTHFSERGREGRLIRLLQDTRNVPEIGTTRGFGMDEETALIVTNLYTQPIGTVIGTNGGVFLADVTNIVVNSSATTDYQQISASYLTLDDTIDLTTGAITIANWKFALKGREQFSNAVPSDDIFSDDDTRQWSDTAQRLFNNINNDTVDNYSADTDPQFLITFDRSQGAGFGGYLPTSPSTFVVSYKNLQVAIRENE